MTRSFTDVVGELAFAQLWQVTLVITAAALFTRLVCAASPFGASHLARSPDQVPHAPFVEQSDRRLQLGAYPIGGRCQKCPGASCSRAEGARRAAGKSDRSGIRNGQAGGCRASASGEQILDLVACGRVGAGAHRIRGHVSATCSSTPARLGCRRGKLCRIRRFRRRRFLAGRSPFALPGRRIGDGALG